MDDGRVKRRPAGRPAVEAALASAGMALFAFLLNFDAGSGLPAVAGLVLTAVAFWLALRAGPRPGRLFGFTPFTRRGWVLTVVGAGVGVGLGVAYRSAWRPTLWPQGLTAFVLVAMAIGAAEETLYRGYVQGRLAVALGVPRPALSGRAFPSPLTGKGKGEGDACVGRNDSPPHPGPLPPGEREAKRVAFVALTILLAAAAHTLYKAALFIRPPEGVEVALGFLVTWTLIGGVAFGLMRVAAGNVWPAVAAHVAFDVIAYGDAAEAPWWVWM